MASPHDRVGSCDNFVAFYVKYVQVYLRLHYTLQ